MGKQKTWIILAIIGIILLIGIFWYVGTYNSLVKLNENVNGEWAQVETQYQRRVDLIPNIVSTVQGYADFEKATLTEITMLRSQWQEAGSVDQKVNTANQIEGAISKLLLITENYPDLKADQNFLALQDELTNTENKIAVERGRYNDAVRMFNTKIKTFPANIVAGSKFVQRTYFNAQENADTVPVVDFTK
ncbi:MAG: LemA family protein [Candidatus Nanoarchaeia archaeon]